MIDQDTETPVSGLRQLRREVAPTRDLWPDIESRLRRRRHPAPWISLALAASLVIGLAVSVRQQGLVVPEGTVAVALAAPQSARLELEGPNRALVKANLKIVSDAEKQLRDALKQSPDSQSLKRLLDSTQRQRRDLRRLLSKAPV